MKAYSSINYAFLNTLIRAKESRVLTEGEMERMIEAKNPSEAYKVLNDLDYADFFGEDDRPEDFQMVIDAGLKETKDLIQKNAPYQEVPKLIWAKYDFHNLKVLLKAKIQEKPLAEVNAVLSEMGEEKIETLLSLIEKSPVDNSLPGILVKEKFINTAITEAIEAYRQTEDPILIDAAVDRSYFAFLQNQISKLKTTFLNDYFHLLVDLNNIQIYLRVLSIEKKEFFPKLFITGGTLSSNFFSGDLSEFKERLALTQYGEKLAQALKVYEEEKSFTQLEKDSDLMIHNHMLGARYIPFGPEPMFAFFWIKENNAQIIRTIMVNKLNKIEPAQIRKKIKKLYV